MLATIAYGIGLCNKSVILEDFAHVEIIACLWLLGNDGTPLKYSYLSNWLPSKHTPCDIIRLLLKSTTMFVVSEYKLFEENRLSPSKLRIIEW